MSWVKAAGCESATCIEIAQADKVWMPNFLGASFAMRATEFDAGTVIWVTRKELEVFLAGVKAGDFDHLLDT